MNLSDKLRLVINGINGEFTAQQVADLLSCDKSSIGGNITRMKSLGEVSVIRKEHQGSGGKITIYKANKVLKLVNRKTLRSKVVEVVKFTTTDRFLMMPAPLITKGGSKCLY